LTIMRISPRHIGLAALILLEAGALIVLAGQIASGASPSALAATTVAALVLGGIGIGYWRAWPYAGHSIVALLTLLTAFTTPEPFVTRQLTYSLLIPPILALIISGPFWVLGSGSVIIAVMAIRAGGIGPYADPLVLTLYGLAVGGLFLSRLITDYAQRSAEASAMRAEESRARAEQQALELAQQTQTLTKQNTQQQQLLDLVTTLETPVVQLAEGVLFAPVVGHVDSRRAQELTRRLLEEVASNRARRLVLDVAGVATMDTVVAKALVDATRALRLLGCRVTISGISAAVAATLTHLGANLEGVTTVRSPYEALADSIRANGARGPGMN
jgi:anti-anti-sigma regulatory factor